MKKRHKKVVDKEAAAVVEQQQHPEGSGSDHNETHVEDVKSHATESREGEF